MPSDERHKLRLEKSKPLALAFFNWCERQNVLPKSATGRAIHYALEQKRWLMNVYLDGRTEISNNRIENSVRPFAVGRRNWLFCDKVLYDEMRKAGFDDFIRYIPDGNTFWQFLTGMAKDGTCVSCKAGSGDPGCAVRICAKEKGVEMCAFCDSYSCEKINPFFEGYPILKSDNARLRDEGWDAWGKLQDERVARGFTYQDEK